MPVHLGPGPVFVYEWLTTSRRWQLYAMRVLFGGVILIGLALVWQQVTRYRPAGELVSLADAAEYGAAVYFSIVLIELPLALLVAPVATAGAVCLDKARGTLDHMLATDLSNAEIVLGKLAVRLVPVLGLVACILPVVAITSMLGGIDPLALVGSFLVTTGCAVLGCSLAVTLSVWARKTHEVLMTVYLILIAWLMLPILADVVLSVFRTAPLPPSALLFWQFLLTTNPYYLICARYNSPGRVDLSTFLVFLAGCLMTSGALVGLATLRVRRVAMRQAGRPPAVGGRRRLPRLRRPSWIPRIPGPSLDANPVAWREWHRTQPSRLMRVVWGFYSALGLLYVVIILNLSGPARESAAPALTLGSPGNFGRLSFG